MATFPSQGGVLVFGGAGVDLIAQVDSFPEEDTKIRTKKAKLLVGGNAANTSAALARLGVNTSLVTKVGGDSNGSFLLKSLSTVMGVCVDDIIITKDATAFTYVIVCQNSRSRTCIHTPLKSEISCAEVLQYTDSSMKIDHIQCIHFDSRHTDASVTLAEYISQHCESKILSVDVERNRPQLSQLIKYCEVVFTNKKGIENMFPTFSGTTDEDYLLQASSYFVNDDSCCKLVVVTQGSHGSCALFSLPNSSNSINENENTSFFNLGFNDLCNAGIFTSNFIDEKALLREGMTKLVTTLKLSVKYENIYSRSNCKQFGVIRCSSFEIDSADIADTTGAGDAFIGGFLFGLTQQFSIQECMIIGTVVATEKLYALGAQTNLPSLEKVVDVVTSRASSSYILSLRDLS